LIPRIDINEKKLDALTVQTKENSRQIHEQSVMLTQISSESSGFKYFIAGTVTLAGVSASTVATLEYFDDIKEKRKVEEKEKKRERSKEDREKKKEKERKAKGRERKLK
jgi:hypothetical protein